MEEEVNNTSPMITEAKPITIVPTPIPISANPWDCAINAPDTATKPLDSNRPRTIIESVFTPWARIICGFTPVARIDVPNSVPKNQNRKSPTTIVTATPIIVKAIALDIPTL